MVRARAPDDFVSDSRWQGEVQTALNLSPIPPKENSLAMFIRRLHSVVFAAAVLLAGCTESDPHWPPPLASARERELVAAAKDAVDQHDGWGGKAEYVIERRGAFWRVTAWKIVHPEKKGKMRCVPWLASTVVIDDQTRVVEYLRQK